MPNKVKSGKNERILLVDTEHCVLESLQELLTLEGYCVDIADSGAEGIRKLDTTADNHNKFDLVISDLVMPQINGLKVLEKAHSLDPNTIVILMTGYATLESAVESIRKGAYEYLLKPFLIPDLMIIIERGLEKRRLHLENKRLITNLKEKNNALELALAQLKTAQTQLIEIAQKQAVNETIANLKHEIINPLTTILARVQLIMEQSNQDNNNEFFKYLKIIQEQSVRISTILSDLDESSKHSYALFE